MATKRYAKALLARKNVELGEWMDVIRTQNEGVVPKDYVSRVAKTVLRKCDPKQYLLSHATIVASVDTFAPKGAKTGRSLNRGIQIDVRWPDFRIKPECEDIINNNGDAWERSLLLSTYRTFIGAQNYLEHIQIPELSKGFIVDAVARDLGKTCYVDILVATDRKHSKLISDILSGEMNSFSMGCISLFTTCTKCGNVAADDSQLCPCILYEGKHSVYTEDGQKYKIAELIGHTSVPNSNQFIEASWVKAPAFTGAVRRNFLNGDSPHFAAMLDEASVVHEVRTLVQIPDGVKKAASTRVAQADDQDQGQDQGGLGDIDQLDSDLEQGSDEQDSDESKSDDQGDDSKESGASSESSKEDKMDVLLDKAQEQLLSMLVEKLGDRLKPKPEDVGSVAPAPLPNLESGNNNLVRSSEDFSRNLRSKFPDSPTLVKWAESAWKTVHVGGIEAIRSASMTPRDLIVLSWIEDRVRGREYPSHLYNLAMKIGSISNFPSETSYLAACSIKAGRKLNPSESQFLTWKGRIAAVATSSR